MKRALKSLIVIAALALTVSGCSKEGTKVLKDGVLCIEVTYSDEGSCTQQYANIEFSAKGIPFFTVLTPSGTSSMKMPVQSRTEFGLSAQLKDGFTFEDDQLYSFVFSARAVVSVLDKEGNLISSASVEFSTEQRTNVDGKKAGYLMKDLLADLSASYNCVVDNYGQVTLYKLDK